MIKIILCLLFMAFNIYGAEIFGIVQKIEGSVSSNQIPLHQNDKVYIGSNITSENNSKAIIIQANGNIMTIGKNCNIVLDALNQIEQKQGSSFFNILSKVILEANEYKYKIKIKTASIGIRGTNFIVTSSKTDNVILRKGQLDIAAQKDKFKIFSSKTNNFDKFSNQQKKEYEEFSNNLNTDFLAYKKQLQFEFEQYAASFKLEEKTIIAIGSNNEVYKIKLSDEDINNQFEEFDSFIDETSFPISLNATPSQIEDNVKLSATYANYVEESKDCEDENLTISKTPYILQSEYKNIPQEELEEMLHTK